jgi:predicted esterase
LEPFLEACQRYWLASQVADIVAIEPTQATAARRFPALVILPPDGESPSHFVRRADWQPLADHLGMAVVGVSGSAPEGLRRFRWSRDGTRNHNHIRYQLDSGMSGPKYQLGELIAVGFAEAGPLAFELAAKYPRYFQGAVIVSPRNPSIEMEKIPRDGLHLQTGFVIVTSSEDSVETQELTQLYADWARTVGAHASHEVLSGRLTAVPTPEFREKLLGWVEHLKAVAGIKTPAKAASASP